MTYEEQYRLERPPPGYEQQETRRYLEWINAAESKEVKVSSGFSKQAPEIRLEVVGREGSIKIVELSEVDFTIKPKAKRWIYSRSPDQFLVKAFYDKKAGAIMIPDSPKRPKLLKELLQRAVRVGIL